MTQRGRVDHPQPVNRRAVLRAGLQSRYAPVLRQVDLRPGVLDLLHRAPDGLPVGHLRLTDVGLDVELAAHPVDQDVQVQLAHPADHGLAGLLV